MRNFRAIFGRLAGETRGAEIAEAAAVLPIMFMILIGIFWFGQAFSIYGTITRAAQEGARAGAAVPQCTTCAPSANSAAANAEAAVNAALTTAKLDPAQAQLPSPAPTFPASSCRGTGRCDGSSANVCVQNNVQLNAPNTDALCGIAVTFQYPFKFTLPFTTLNNTRILMTASARVRLETQ